MSSCPQRGSGGPCEEGRGGGPQWGASGTKSPPLSFPSPQLLDQCKVRRLTMLVSKEAFKDHEVVHLEDEANKAHCPLSFSTQWVRTATGVPACPPWGPGVKPQPHTLGTVAHACYPSPWKKKVGRPSSRLASATQRAGCQPGLHETLPQETKTRGWRDGVSNSQSLP